MELDLYQFEGCPYCAKVRKKMTQLGLKFTAYQPRHNDDHMDRLMELGGQDQVPFLVVRNEDGNVVESMYESDDINEFLEEEFGA